RFKIEDVDHVGLLYADLDVKPGSFVSQQDAINFLRSLPYQPNCVVSSGSGGLHAYCRIEGLAGPRSINPHIGKDLLVKWWAYLQRQPQVERLTDCMMLHECPAYLALSAGLSLMKMLYLARLNFSQPTERAQSWRWTFWLSPKTLGIGCKISVSRFARRMSPCLSMSQRQ